MTGKLAFITLFLILSGISFLSSCKNEKANNSMSTEELNRKIGTWVTIEGILSGEKPPTINGIEVGASPVHSGKAFSRGILVRFEKVDNLFSDNEIVITGFRLIDPYLLGHAKTFATLSEVENYYFDMKDQLNAKE